MQGTRVDGKSPHELEVGEYTLYKGNWYVCCPGDLLANCGGHQCTVEADGSLTVTPSILVNRDKPNTWHGYLTKGVLTEC